MSLEIWLAFTLASAVLLAIPGPTVMLVVSYALGRGLDYRDTHVIDSIVDRLALENGRISALITGIIESAPFQKRGTRLPWSNLN